MPRSLSSVGVGCGGIDLFVGMRYFESVVVLQDRKKRDSVQRRLGLVRRNRRRISSRSRWQMVLSRPCAVVLL